MERPGALFRWCAFASAFVTWALVAVGGLVRVSESGLGCPDWPLCEGNVVPADQKAPIIEFSHRATAAAATLLVATVCLWAWRSHRPRREIVVPATVALVLVPFQAVLGAVVVLLELPSWIVGVHFVVGMLFLAATVAAATAAWRSGETVSPRYARLAAAGALVGLVAVSLGASVVSAHADGACGHEWPSCNGSFVSGGGDGALQVGHRMGAYVVAGLVLALAVVAFRGGGPRVPALLGVAAVAAQIAIGVAMVLTGEGSGAREALEVATIAYQSRPRWAPGRRVAVHPRPVAR